MAVWPRSLRFVRAEWLGDNKTTTLSSALIPAKAATQGRRTRWVRRTFQRATDNAAPSPLSPRLRGEERIESAHPPAGDALDFFFDLGLHDGRQVVVKPVLQQRTQQLADHIFQQLAGLWHGYGLSQLTER
jgi:hypothetical protein